MAMVVAYKVLFKNPKTQNGKRLTLKDEKYFVYGKYLKNVFGI